MKRFVSLLALATLTIPTHAAVGYFGNFFVVIDDGGGNDFYQTTDANQLTNAGGGFSTTSNGFNPVFSGADLGSFNPSTQSLTLNGFEMNTFNNGGDSVNDATIAYRVYSGSPSGSESFYSDFSPNSVSGDDKFWQITDANIDLLDGLSNGTYTLEIYVANAASFTSGGGGTFTMFNWNSGGRPTASFTVVPEPSIALLGGLGLLGLLRRRR